MLTTVTTKFWQYEIWAHFLRANFKGVREKYGITDIAHVSLDMYAQCRFLAKIAHGYAVRELGLDGFIPFLPNYILGDYDLWCFCYVGGTYAGKKARKLEQKGEELHEISIEEPSASTWPFVMVRLRLFSCYGAPTFRIIAGYRLNPMPTLEVQLEAAKAGRANPTINSFPNIPLPVGFYDPEVKVSGNIPKVPKRYYRVAVKPKGETVVER